MSFLMVPTLLQDIPFETLPQEFEYSGGFLITITSTYQQYTYVQTFANDGSHITSTTGWVLQ